MVLAATGEVHEQPVSAISWGTTPEQAGSEDVAKACQLMDHSMLVRLSCAHFSETIAWCLQGPAAASAMVTVLNPG